MQALSEQVVYLGCQRCAVRGGERLAVTPRVRQDDVDAVDELAHDPLDERGGGTAGRSSTRTPRRRGRRPRRGRRRCPGAGRGPRRGRRGHPRPPGASAAVAPGHGPRSPERRRPWSGCRRCAEAASSRATQALPWVAPCARTVPPRGSRLSHISAVVLSGGSPGPDESTDASCARGRSGSGRVPSASRESGRLRAQRPAHSRHLPAEEPTHGAHEVQRACHHDDVPLGRKSVRGPQRTRGRVGTHSPTPTAPDGRCQSGRGG